RLENDLAVVHNHAPSRFPTVGNRAWLLHDDFAGERVPERVDGADEPRFARIVAESCPQTPDDSRQIVLSHKGVAPHSADQLVFPKRLGPVLDQELQELEFLGRQTKFAITREKAPLFQVDDELSKRQPHDHAIIETLTVRLLVRLLREHSYPT